MLQLELYVDGVEEPANLFAEVFGMTVTQSHDGWRTLSHTSNYQIMLFDEAKHAHEEGHWKFPDGPKGSGIEIILVTDNVAGKHEKISALGYTCTALRSPPWGGVDFFFTLKEGYVIRVKQPA